MVYNSLISWDSDWNFKSKVILEINILCMSYVIILTWTMQNPIKWYINTGSGKDLEPIGKKSWSPDLIFI